MPLHMLQTMPLHMLQTMPLHMLQTMPLHMLQTMPLHMLQTMPLHMLQTMPPPLHAPPTGPAPPYDCRRWAAERARFWSSSTWTRISSALSGSFCSPSPDTFASSA